jgi:hypothetical protein
MFTTQRMGSSSISFGDAQSIQECENKREPKPAVEQQRQPSPPKQVCERELK